MARVVESATRDMGNRVKVAKVVTRTMEGAIRYRELVKQLQRQVPVPSIVVNGMLAFEQTPGEQDLVDYLTSLSGPAKG